MAENKSKAVTFRTTKELADRVDDLASRARKKQFSFTWKSVASQCTSRSSLIHYVLSGKINLDDLENQLEEIEKEEAE